VATLPHVSARMQTSAIRLHERGIETPPWHSSDGLSCGRLPL
jgi:hypothetical protein